VIRGEVEAIARECGLEGEELGDVRLAVSEAAANAVVHGSAGREDAHVGLCVELFDREMRVTVSDGGVGLKPRALDSQGLGAGLGLIAIVTGRLDVRSSSEGTDVHMTFPCPAAVASQEEASPAQRLQEAADHVHDSAVRRLDEALAEQDRLGERFDAAVGTLTELEASARLKGADEQVTARRAWVSWVEHESVAGRAWRPAGTGGSLL
jgi:anti-sigma regulatory factor (Ser/Thr protein kinase)